jgi:hypothetical protein
MSDRFFSAFEPNLAKKMVDALERAWAGFEPTPKNELIARPVLASSIVNSVEAGSKSPDTWAQMATLILHNANRANPELLAALSGSGH